MSPEARGGNATASAAAAVVGAGISGNQSHESRSSESSLQAPANGDRETGFAPMERFERESEREMPFGGKRE